jgi:hypothetical protein
MEFLEKLNILFLALWPNAGYDFLIHPFSRTHTTTHRSREDYSGRAISSPDNTKHLQDTDSHTPGGIRTHDLSRLAAADLRLIPRGQWEQLNIFREIFSAGVRKFTACLIKI